MALDNNLYILSYDNNRNTAIKLKPFNNGTFKGFFSLDSKISNYRSKLMAVNCIVIVEIGTPLITLINKGLQSFSVNAVIVTS